MALSARTHYCHLRTSRRYLLPALVAGRVSRSLASPANGGCGSVGLWVCLPACLSGLRIAPLTKRSPQIHIAHRPEDNRLLNIGNLAFACLILFSICSLNAPAAVHWASILSSGSGGQAARPNRCESGALIGKQWPLAARPFSKKFQRSWPDKARSALLSVFVFPTRAEARRHFPVNQPSGAPTIAAAPPHLPASSHSDTLRYLPALRSSTPPGRPPDCPIATRTERCAIKGGAGRNYRAPLVQPDREIPTSAPL